MGARASWVSSRTSSAFSSWRRSGGARLGRRGPHLTLDDTLRHRRDPGPHRRPDHRQKEPCPCEGGGRRQPPGALAPAPDPHGPQPAHPPTAPLSSRTDALMDRPRGLGDRMVHLDLPHHPHRRPPPRLLRPRRSRPPRPRPHVRPPFPPLRVRASGVENQASLPVLSQELPSPLRGGRCPMGG